MNQYDAREWYAMLVKPEWAPPEWLFGPVWTVLYAMIIASFGFVLWQCLRGQLPWRTFLPFGLNMVFNLLFSPLQFGLRNNILASVDILLVLATLVWLLLSIRPLVPWVAFVNLPYLIWVSFATVLQLTITWLNRS